MGRRTVAILVRPEGARPRPLRLLSEAEPTAGGLVTIPGPSQPRVSHNPKLLVDGGLAGRRRDGAWAFLTAADRRRRENALPGPAAPRYVVKDNIGGAGMDVVAEIRGFNRFYTREIGLLDEHMPDSEFALAEARVLYELAQSEQAAADLGRALGLDKARLSRIVAGFRARGLVAAEPDPRNNKRLTLSLTASGRSAFSTLEDGTRARMAALLADVDDGGRRRLVSAMRAIEAALRPGAAPPAAVALRSLRPGDLGWITHRQAVLYHREYGWDWTYEGLVSRILSDFVAGFDPAGEDAWVAERDGEVVGSVFLVKGAEPGVAKLRLLYVEPSARGLGVGQDLVARCVLRARELGHGRLMLWTNSVLGSARRVYERAGFRLVGEEPHRSFGQDLIGQTWSLDLTGAAAEPAGGR